MSELKPCPYPDGYPDDLPGRLRWWAGNCDRTNFGCQVKDMLRIAADEIDRRAAYEDTGLEPEEVAALAKAQQDGRLVVLPCKVGDKIFEITKGLSIYQSGLNAYVSERAATKLEIFNWIRRREFGTTVFLTREEAEAAINEKETKQ